MNNAQDFISAAQAQAIEAIRSGQAAAVEAVQAWSQAVANVHPRGSRRGAGPRRAGHHR